MPDLTLRTTIIAGDRLADDFGVHWNGLPVGRILKQPGVPQGRPNWSWGVSFPGMPQQSSHRGLCSDLDECKRRFKVAWSGIEAGLSEADIDHARKVVEASRQLTRKWAGRA